MTRQFAVIPAHGWFSHNVARVYSAHATKAAALKAADRHTVSLPGDVPNRRCAMVICGDGRPSGFRKGEKVYGDTIGSIFPVVP